ncbi:MAG: pyrimidine dimer DNA glycosylase/endonuclease V [Abditibacteriales bacterium]|nr:pyrimidine dimer DNA glycosylase/endonuclease V [Abditibacteriales bacterium]MDW8366824.1 pyrimidine dimer DNA glycosylase/endonuclease V [Abditibacteriales bacterium]
MRIWSLHPKYLDARGLVALWREALLAQAVLRGATRGYLHHPQLRRFQNTTCPMGFIADYLRGVHEEATRRGYRFAAEKIGCARAPGQLTVTDGQLAFEWHHLMRKLATRDPQWRAQLASVGSPRPHPLFRVIRGGVEPWEKGAGADTLLERPT